MPGAPAAETRDRFSRSLRERPGPGGPESQDVKKCAEAFFSQTFEVFGFLGIFRNS